MRHQVICQQCGAVNATEAVVCAACGTRLEHPERQWFNRMRDSEGFRRLRTAPVRAAKTLTRRLWTVFVVLAILLVLVLGVVCFGLFGSVGWEEFPEPAGLSEEETRLADAFVDAVVEGRGGIFTFTPAVILTFVLIRKRRRRGKSPSAAPGRRSRKRTRPPNPNRRCRRAGWRNGPKTPGRVSATAA